MRNHFNFRNLVTGFSFALSLKPNAIQSVITLDGHSHFTLSSAIPHALLWIIIVLSEALLRATTFDSNPQNTSLRAWTRSRAELTRVGQRTGIMTLVEASPCIGIKGHTYAFQRMFDLESDKSARIEAYLSTRAIGLYRLFGRKLNQSLA